MSEVCQKCTFNITSTQQKIKCVRCSKRYHINCMNPTIGELQYLKDNKEKWQCLTCIESNTKLRNTGSSSYYVPDEIPASVDVDPNDGQLNTSTALAHIIGQLKTVLEVQSETTTSINLCHEKIDELNNNFKKLSDAVTACEKNIEALETKNVILQRENSEIKEKLNELEQYTRKNIFEVYGVPESPGENIAVVVQAVANSIGFKLERWMIDTTHRLRKNANRPDQARGIIIKFVRRLDKEEFMRLKRVKRELKVSDLGSDFRNLIKQDNYIYVNDSLTVTNKILLNKAREFKKQNNVKYLWIRNGKIFMRVNEQSRVYEIKSSNDLRDVH
ncbi:hypothetical protein PPYR_10995 [Photinus pyralis]|uniref:PHD-type domain-containing protein n=1 Tax=Photinus pyralis TaxID=7054 RepID=A0A5N4AHZ6_PHOPY|nr:uncharacterized protein LOC116181300 isoform X1 [Photinus pyralis]XP_031357480.1 uncharacterized protein LOC116181300 isoform X1 [Photinus pyralis]KAB0796934.1 hypothetical protein PPYR_10995 [Photinus pyralis]